MTNDFISELKRYFEYDYRSAKTEHLRADLRRLRSVERGHGLPQIIGLDLYPDTWEETTFLENMIKAMKSELSTRPNVPNKKQSKELRRKKAQGK